MKMPYRLRPLPKQPVWKVNDRQDLLDEMYDKLFGRIGEMAKGQPGVTSTRGRDLLPEEIKVSIHFSKSQKFASTLTRGDSG